MGKRPIRILPNDLALESSKHIGQHVQVVAIDGRTHAGKLIECKSEAVVIEDSNANWTNRKSHRHLLPFKEIQYIVVDIVSAW